MLSFVPRSLDRTSLGRARSGRASLVAVGAALLLAVTPGTSAAHHAPGHGGGHHGGYGYHGGHHQGYHGGYYGGYYGGNWRVTPYYAPRVYAPSVYYAPPPVYYAPPPAYYSYPVPYN